MLRRIDVRDIIKDHVNTLYDARTNRRSNGDVFLFFIFPALVAGVLVWAEIRLTSPIANQVITALAIFAGLLFNLLLLAHSLMEKASADKGIVKRVIREIYSNISFAILVALVLIFVSVASLLSKAPAFSVVISIIAFYFLLNFLLTLLMILSRIHTLLSRDFNLN